MNKFFMTVAAGATCFGIVTAGAQEMTLEGAKVMLTEVPGVSDCTPPGGAPAVPDGATATEDDMNGVVAEYNSWGERIAGYQECIDAAAKAAGDGLTPEQDQAVTMVYDSFVGEQEVFVEAYNAQTAAFQEANPE